LEYRARRLCCERCGKPKREYGGLAAHSQEWLRGGRRKRGIGRLLREKRQSGDWSSQVTANAMGVSFLFCSEARKS
jgi:hypothetical protein